MKQPTTPADKQQAPTTVGSGDLLGGRLFVINREECLKSIMESVAFSARQYQMNESDYIALVTGAEFGRAVLAARENFYKRVLKPNPFFGKTKLSNTMLGVVNMSAGKLGFYKPIRDALHRGFDFFFVFFRSHKIKCDALPPNEKS